ncbi:MAG: DsrE family protein [Acetobacteraceae bacterium]|nr:DsrE family protein [Acetobacteraceae bacterium]
MPAEPLAILLIDGSHSRAHYAFVMATAAAALGRMVTVFGTNAGCHALLADWSGLADAARDAVIRSRGVAGFAELREAAQELGVRLMVCEAGLRSEGIDPGLLLPGVEVTGIASLLEASGGGPIVAL